MRKALILGFAALAAACASTGPESGGGLERYGRYGRHASSLSAADRADPAGALSRAGAGDAITADGARTLFGKPDVERRDGAGAILTYKTPRCALALVFSGPGLRLAAVAADARRPGDPPPGLSVCVAEARSRQRVS